MTERITGYRPLSDEEVATINRVKAMAEEVGKLVEDLKVTLNIDQRWVSIGATYLQQGFMSLNRAIAQPTTF